jgi:hypothetical protein
MANGLMVFQKKEILAPGIVGTSRYTTTLWLVRLDAPYPQGAVLTIETTGYEVKQNPHKHIIEACQSSIIDNSARYTAKNDKHTWNRF